MSACHDWVVVGGAPQSLGPTSWRSGWCQRTVRRPARAAVLPGTDYRAVRSPHYAGFRALLRAIVKLGDRELPTINYRHWWATRIQ